MLKIEIRKNKENEDRMNCSIQCAGTAMDVIAETAEMVKKIKESIVESGGPELEVLFVAAISAVIMDKELDDLAEDIMKGFREEEEEKDS